MTEIDEEVYSTIFSALKHGVRRRILWMLAEGQKNFTTLYETLEITSSHLNYHLDSLGELVSKDDGTYRLSVFGKAAVDMMRSIESPPKLGVLGLEGNRWRMITSVLLVCLVMVSGLLVYEIKNDDSIVPDLDGKQTGFDNIEGVAVPGLYDVIDEINSDSGIVLVKKKELRYRYEDEWSLTSTLSMIQDSTNTIMVFYVPVDNATLNLIAIHGYNSEFKSMPLTIQKGDALNNESAILAKDGYIRDRYYQIWQSEILWSVNTTGYGNIYDVTIPSKGWYTLCMTGPITRSGSNPSVKYMWGNREDWLEIESVYARVYCTLFKDDKQILFATKELMDYSLLQYTLEEITNTIFR